VKGAAFALALALGGCGYSADEDLEAESAAILARVPIGTQFDSVPALMQKRGYACTADVKQFVDRKGVMRKAEGHLSCEREESWWLVCTKRLRVVLLQHNGRLSNVLVNAGMFC
jgi:hypothetical protein